VPELLAVDRDEIQRQLANRGYQNATVDARPQFSQDGTRADILFTVHEGPRFSWTTCWSSATCGPDRNIERELQLKAGDPLGLEAVNESQRRLSSLGLFRRAITALAHGDETRRDLL
jgi:outer membrane protein assembly factor BamA